MESKAKDYLDRAQELFPDFELKNDLKVPGSALDAMAEYRFRTISNDSAIPYAPYITLWGKDGHVVMENSWLYRDENRQSHIHIEIIGDSYPHRETLRSAGFEWDKERRCWVKEIAGSPSTVGEAIRELGFTRLFTHETFFIQSNIERLVDEKKRWRVGGTGSISDNMLIYDLDMRRRTMEAFIHWLWQVKGWDFEDAGWLAEKIETHMPPRVLERYGISK